MSKLQNFNAQVRKEEHPPLHLTFEWLDNFIGLIKELDSDHENLKDVVKDAVDDMNNRLEALEIRLGALENRLVQGDK